ncbi:amidohydrolase [Pontibacillus chungwhensis BH030062]|uniref:Amidohydrolase n=1 Tax=Pontibacillus chungwhensis BH030062 TaxID=1385513 RepID=A0A0A2UXL5_9BACI|nr:amidohydrolase [Pontibacillus chungwhensis]KGP91493.1 amidohydrolase [Pontibacillus chungwhensis BH030062]
MKLIKNGTIIVGNGETLTNASVLIEGGKVTQVGQVTHSEEPEQVIDATGLYITPGLIDVHTHLGVHEEGIGQPGQDFNETSSPITPEIRALDGINPRDKGFEDARKAGVTTVQVLPGSANVIGGEMVTLKTSGNVVDEMVLRRPSGMKAAFGENPKRLHGSKGHAPVTRMGIAAMFRQQLRKAQQYKQKLERRENVEDNLGLENLGKVLDKEIPLRAHAHRADDIVTLLRLAKEFDLDISIEHCTEGHQIPDYIAQFNFPAAVGPTMSTRSKVELSDKGWETAGILNQAGVSVSITTDHPVVGIEYLRMSAIQAANHGLEKKDAWSSITLNAAKHLGVDERVGSLEAGKDADVVLWNDDPFNGSSYVLKTFVNGEEVYALD